MGVDIFTVKSTLEVLGPHRREVVEPIRKEFSTRGKLWLKEPYSHEYALAYIYFGLEEREEKFTPEDQNFLTIVFKWIKDLDMKRFPKQEWIPDRPGPLFLRGNEKGIIDEHLDHLKQNDFLNHPEYKEALINSLRYFTRSLVAEKILAPDYDIFNSLQNQPA
ncbi:hypothetical protein HZA76_02415 [Candidatus Roizmanbacteria bacterium]|nr:hypothetical protein [Candidatus Roizmanbacteria bacterium]